MIWVSVKVRYSDMCKLSRTPAQKFTLNIAAAALVFSRSDLLSWAVSQNSKLLLGHMSTSTLQRYTLLHSYILSVSDDPIRTFTLGSRAK